MNASDADRQIKQMVNFILQEAQEKANEIRIKTEHDFNLEKQMLVHNAKLKIQQEYARKEKEREINKRIARSSEIGNSRRQKMMAREELLQVLSADAKKQCLTITSDQQRYKTLMKDLIVQGLIKLDEVDVVIRCREIDQSLVEGLLPQAIADYKETMKTQANVDVDVNLIVNKTEKLNVSANRYCIFQSLYQSSSNLDSAGGVVLTAKIGKICCDNTLDTYVLKNSK